MNTSSTNGLIAIYKEGVSTLEEKENVMRKLGYRGSWMRCSEKSDINGSKSSEDDVADFAIGLRMFTKKSGLFRSESSDFNLELKLSKLMRSDKLYKFSDGTLTRLLSSLEDITKNIDMEYLPKRRWSTLEKKRAHL
ncbi:hypothetical protein Tco_0174651 [Tanacetum coccineum]